MAKDYFQDIIPPRGGRKIPIRTNQRVEPAHSDAPQELGEDDDTLSISAEKSIRNIASVRRARAENPEISQYSPPIPPRRKSPSYRWLWIGAGAALLVLALLILVALRPTTVTVIPRTHAVIFDQSSAFTAYPESTAADGTFAYSVQAIALEESENVQSTGTVRAEEKASGTVTIRNSGTTQVRLIKNTRFQSANGLIFRAPAEVIVPPKKGSVNGSVDVTIIADQAGENYNIGPTTFTVPGLRGTPEYSRISAESTEAFSGGFVGDRPGVSDADRNAALATLQGRLEQKARAAAQSASDGGAVAFSDLMHITYSEPRTAEEGSGARITQRADIRIPVFSADRFAEAVARSVLAESDGLSVRLIRGNDFSVHLQSATSTFGTGPLQFTMSGRATIVWNVDAEALAKALAGREQSAFETVVNSFPGIQSARARIEPFWSKAFPEDPSEIKVTVNGPENE